MIQGQVVDGRFECRGTVTRPEPGEAWFAWDGDHEVVLRLLPGVPGDGSERDAFMRMARSAMKLTRDSIEKTIHAGFTGDHRAYVVTEKISGRTLSEEMSASRPFDVQRALGTAAAVAGALADAAAHGHFHGHLSPAVIVFAGGSSRKGKRRAQTTQVKVLGFAPWEAVPSPTVYNRDCAAPEVTAGAVPDIRSDCWSLGIILYRMLTGAVPELASGGRGKAGRHQARIMPPSAVRSEAGITPEMDMLVLRLLEKDPAKRLDATEHLVSHIKSLMNGAEAGNGDPDAAATVVTDMPPAMHDTAESDIDEGISFASGRKVRTTSFAAAEILESSPATDGMAAPTGIAAAEAGQSTGAKPAPAVATGTGGGTARSGRSSLVAVVVLVGFFVLAAIAVSGWFVLQYQARQIELAKASAAPAAQVAAPAVQVPATAPRVATPVVPSPSPQGASPAVQVPVTAPQAAATTAPGPAAETAPVSAKVAPASTPSVKPAAAVSKTTEKAATTAPKAGTVATTPTRKPATATTSPEKAAATAKKSTTASTARKPNWDDGLESGDIETAPAPKPAATTPKKESKPSLDWGD